MAIFLNQTHKTAQTSILETVALVVVIALVGWFFVKPQSATLSDRKMLLEQARTDYTNVEQDKNTLAQLAAKLKGSGTDIALVDEALPLHNRPTHLEVLLDSLITASGMKIVDMDFRPSEDATVVAGEKNSLANEYSVARKLATTDLDLTIGGGIDQFRNFLQLLETNGRVVDVTNLDMINEEGNPVFKIKLKAYSYVP
jgi:hypothetical protein